MKRELSPAWTLAILTGLNLFNYLDRYVLSAVLAPMMDELRLTNDQAGTIGTAFMLGYFLTSPFFGFLGDRAPGKWLIALGIFVWSVGTVLSGTAQSLAALILWRVLVGVGEASYATISPSIISDRFTGPSRNTALTIFYVALPVGGALGFWLGGQIAASASWRHAFMYAGAPGLLLALVLLPFREPARATDGKRHSDDTAKPRLTDMLKLFRVRSFLLVVCGYTAYTFALGGFQHWGSTFLQRVHGLPVNEAGNFFGASLAVAGLVGTFLGGFAATAWRKRNPAAYALVIGLSVAAAVPVAFGAFLVPERRLSMALLAIAMFLLFLSTGPVNTLILESVPANLRASAMALSIFTIHLFGDLWSPKIVGRIADASTLGQAVLILPGALIPAALLWLALAARMRRESV